MAEELMTLLHLFVLGVLIACLRAIRTNPR